MNQSQSSKQSNSKDGPTMMELKIMNDVKVINDQINEMETILTNVNQKMKTNCLEVKSLKMRLVKRIPKSAMSAYSIKKEKQSDIKSNETVNDHVADHEAIFPSTTYVNDLSKDKPIKKIVPKRTRTKCSTLSSSSSNSSSSCSKKEEKVVNSIPERNYSFSSSQHLNLSLGNNSNNTVVHSTEILNPVENECSWSLRIVPISTLNYKSRTNTNNSSNRTITPIL